MLSPHFKHAPQKIQLRKQSYGLEVNCERHKNLNSPPMATRMNEHRQHQARCSQRQRHSKNLNARGSLFYGLSSTAYLE